jgi:hypothetical protein
MVAVRIAVLVLCIVASGAASATPGNLNGAAGGIRNAPDCASVHKRFDADRGQMELLMGALQNEDAKPESATRFKRMCAIDRSISDAARRLSALISGSGKACLSADDRSQAAQMRHLSAPIPECAGAGSDKVKTVRAKQPKAASVAKTRKITTASKGTEPRKVKPRAAPVSNSLGLMADLY